MTELERLLTTPPAAAVDLAAVERLPGTSGTDPFWRLAAAFIHAYPRTTARAYFTDLCDWARWCDTLDAHPLTARRHHADAWIRHLTTDPQRKTGRPAAAATVARKLSAVAQFYDYAIHDAEVVTYSPVANVRRPKVSAESSTVGLSADELRRLLTIAEADSPRAAALIGLLTLNGLRISEALGADVRDYGHDRGHRVLRVTRKGGAVGRVPLAPPVIRALDAYLTGRATGPLFLASDNKSRLGRTTVVYQLQRMAKTAGVPAAALISPHSLRHSFATEALTIGVPLQDVQDALGHADPRTTRRYDRSRNKLDRSPTYLLATHLHHGE